MNLWLGRETSWAHLAHLTTCLWMVAALIQTGEVNLTQWIAYLPCRGVFAQSKQRRVRRWLGNRRINIHKLYKPLIQAALSTWTDECFIHTEAMSLARQLGWHYRIRLKSNSWVGRSNRGWSQLKAFHLKRGEALCFHTVKLHKQQWCGPVHVIFGRNHLNGEFWAVVSDEPTTLQTFAEYGLRFDIEESFLDDQSSGWNLQKSEIRSACDLSRLWFILAVATLYVTAQGVEVVDSGRQRWVDTQLSVSGDCNRYATAQYRCPDYRNKGFEMRRLEVRLYDGFSEAAFGGNVAGVVFEPLDDNALDDKVRQSIAKEIAAPTTGFLHPQGRYRYSLRFFSPTAEMDMCGHVTIGAFAAALDEGLVKLSPSGFAEVVAVTAAGEIPVRVSRDSSGLPRIEMRQRLPRFESYELDWRAFAGFIGLQEDQLHKDLPMGITSTGLRHLFVGVKTVATLREMILNNEALFSFSHHAGVDTIGVYALCSKQDGPTLRLRDLCHGVGNLEEAASGTTNGALASHLTNAGVLSADNAGEVNVLAEMGVEMGRPSVVRTTLKVNNQGKIEVVQVGGCAVKTLSGLLYY